MNDVDDFIARAPWRVAATMPDIPHEYTVRGQTPDEEFEAFVQHIRDHGRVGHWHRYTRPYLDVGEYRYWTMGAPIAKTKIINREKISDSKVWFPHPEGTRS